MDSTNAVVAVLAGLAGFLVVFFIIIIALSVFMLVALFKVYKKAGEEGWKCLIPFYNTYTQCKFIGINPNWVWIMLGLSVLSAVPLVGLVSFVASIYFSILQSVSLARSFGKSDAFAAGLIFLPVVFIPMLAFGDAEYVGPKPMNDIIFKNYHPENTSTGTNVAQDTQAGQQQAPTTEVSSTNASTEVFCSNCGSKLENGSNFCTSCGTKIN